MITGELKNKIDSLWDVFAAGGIVNPLTVVEQMTYLMFIRDIDDADNLKAKEAAMLGLPYESIFAEEVEIGGNKVNGTQLKWSGFLVNDEILVIVHEVAVHGLAGNRLSA